MLINQVAELTRICARSETRSHVAELTCHGIRYLPWDQGYSQNVEGQRIFFTQVAGVSRHAQKRNRLQKTKLTRHVTGYEMCNYQFGNKTKFYCSAENDEAKKRFKSTRCCFITILSPESAIVPLE